MKIKRFPKLSLSSQHDGRALRSASRRKRQESKILELPKNSTPEFLVSLIAKSDDVAELWGIKPNLAIKKCPEHGYTLKAVCGKCGKETKDAHYKFTKFLENIQKTRKE